MSWNPTVSHQDVNALDPEAIAAVIIPRSRDIGGFEVQRALPSFQRRMVGPFVFFDQFGPAEFLTHQGIDIRPHPHIGLGTVIYLYDGHFQHRDSLGTNQIIHPGAVNWMVAGRGVTHSERSTAESRKAPHRLFGLQTWVALPEHLEDIPPRFEHHSQQSLPEFVAEGITARLILGSAYGEEAPAQVHSESFYLDVILQPGAAFPLPDDHEDRGIYITQGDITVAGQVFSAGQMMVFRPGDKISVRAGAAGARLMALGGATLNGPRYIWWNFVSSSKEKIEHAKREWRAENWGQGQFDLPPGDRDEFVPLPQR